MKPFNTDLCICRQGDPVEILPWLYLGNAFHASQEDRLTELGISALLNVAEVDPSAVPVDVSSPTFCHMNLPIADSATSDISCHFPDAIEFIGQLFIKSVFIILKTVDCC